MANERLQGQEQFHSKNYLLEMPRSYAKMGLCNGSSYIKKLHTRLQLEMPLHIPP